MAGYLVLPDLKRASDNQIWFRYVQQEDGIPQIKIYTLAGALVKDISGLGNRPEGSYLSRSRAIFWDRRNTGASLVAAGTYMAYLWIDSVQYDSMKLTLP